nr:nucleotide-binding alpha-beta plait domain-containing protein [Tanacetum cinerariifolium]
MMEFHDEGAKKKFQFNLAMRTWFSQIIQTSSDFNIDERVRWVELEGVPYKLWSRNTFSANDVEGDSDVEAVPESKFKEDPKKHTGDDASVGQNNVHYEDPFDIYDIFDKKRDTNKKDANPKDSLKFPPGFTPRDDVGAAKENSHVQLEKTRERVDQEVGDSVEKQTILNNKGVNDVRIHLLMSL